MSVYAYIGCRTTKERNARGKGISVYSVEKGRWELLQLLEGEVNPSYLCLNEAQNRLYAIHGDFCQVSAYEIHEDGTYGKMAFCGQSPDRRRIRDTRKGGRLPGAY